MSSVRASMPRVAIPLVLAVVVGVFIVHALALELFIDDSYISLRYAQNLVRGEGLVFNPGERVEGYSNLLWTLLLALLMKLGLDPVVWATRLGILAGGATVLCSAGFVVAIEKRAGGLAVAVAALVAGCSSLALWSTSGMETAAFALLVTLALSLGLVPDRTPRSRIWAALVFCAAALTRPDGVLFFGLWIAVRAFDARRDGDARQWRFIARDVLAFVLPLAAVAVWKLVYYGELLPNTYYAKAGVTLEYLTRGLGYLREAVAGPGLWGLALLPAIAAPFHREHAHLARRLSFICLGWVLYVVVIGGDVLPVHRFWLPVVPAGALLVGMGIQEILLRVAGRMSPSRRDALSVLVACVIASTSVAMNWHSVTGLREEWAASLNRMEDTGRWLGSHLPADASIAATAIGAIAYYSDRPVIDMLGLTNPEVSRNPQPIAGLSDSWKERRYNAASVLRQQPELILFSTGVRPSAAAEKALFLYEDFHRRYRPWFFRPNAEFNDVSVAYRRRPDAPLHQDLSHAAMTGFIEDFAAGIRANVGGNDFTRADQRFESAIERAPFEFPQAREWRAVNAYQAGRGDAMERLRAVVAADSLSARAHRLLGWIAHRAGADEEARAVYAQLVRSDPQIEWGWAGLAESLAKAGDLEGAIRMARESLQRWPRDRRRLQLLGDLCRGTGRPQDAITAYRALLRIDPSSEAARRGLRSLGAEP